MKKNCWLREDFIEYMDFRNAQARERADRWTEARFRWDREHPIMAEWVFRTAVFIPVVVPIVYMWRYLWTR